MEDPKTLLGLNLIIYIIMSTTNENTKKINNYQTAGFYYDIQMSNPLLTATLHTNTYISGLIPVTAEGDDSPTSIKWNSNNKRPINIYQQKGKFIWDLWKPISDRENGTESPEDGKVFCLDPLTHHHSLSYNTNPSACYREKPLITSILSEDFIVGVNNQWGDAGGATQIESLFNQMKSSAPYVKEVGGLLRNLSNKISEFVDPNGWLGKGNNYLGQLADRMKTSSADNLNQALVTQGTRFSYYGGTATSFGNLSMKFTLFADWCFENNEWVFRTVHDQLREIYPYAVGKYYPLDLNVRNSVAEGTEWRTAAELADKAISDFFGWQQPPGGFQSDIRSLDTCQKGTLRLVLGGYYTIENLVISDMSVNFSKTMTKIPPKIKMWDTEVKQEIKYTGTFVKESVVYKDGEVETQTTADGIKQIKIQQETIKNTYDAKNSTITNTRALITTDEGFLTPLYADVIINLRPASSYSDNSLINFSSNFGSGKFEYLQAKMRNNQLWKEREKKRSIPEKEETTTSSTTSTTPAPDNVDDSPPESNYHVAEK